MKKKTVRRARVACKATAAKSVRSTKSTAIKNSAAKFDKTAALKAAFLKAYPTLRCNITATAKRIGIDRTTYYLWLESDQAFKAAAVDAFESLIDHVEDELHKMINKGMEPSAIFFFLKTRAKHRGYIEKIDLDGHLRHSNALSVEDLQASTAKYDEAGQ